MRVPSLTCAFSVLLLISLFTSEKSLSAPQSVQAVRTSVPITVDGVLSEEIWQRPGVTDFVQRDPIEGATPSERTEVWIAYDDAALYVAARMYDSSPDSLVVRLSRRDAAWDSDMFAFFLDPYHDRRSGFFYALDAAGTFYDGILLNDDWDDDSWDGVWEGKVQIDREGWTAEMRIPFSQLRFQESENHVWGVNFRRDIARRNERNFVTFKPKNGSGFVSRFIDLVGIRDVHPTQRIEILPYITTRADYSGFDPANPFRNGSKYTPRVGADFKLGIGSNLTLDATVNPDFGQVEVDPAVVNLSDVETFFSEKRPFFNEGSSIFAFGQGGTNNNWGFNWSTMNMVYSRRIGRSPQGSLPDDIDYSDAPEGTRIIGAGKLTGKLGSWNVGTIQAVTAREYADLQTGSQRSSTEVEPLTYYGIARAEKEFEQGRHAIGAISTFTSRQFKDDRLRDDINKDALSLGVDGWTTLDSSGTYVIAGWMAMSRVSGTTSRMLDLQQSSRHYFQRPDASHVSIDSNATSLTGYAARVRFNKQKGNFYTNAALGFIDPKFDVNDVGFVFRTDMINGHLVGSYRWSEPGSWYRYIELGGAGFRTYDFDKNITWQGLFHFGYIQFLNYFAIDWNFAYNPQTVNNRRTRGGPLTLNPPGYQISVAPQTDQNKPIVFRFNYYTYQSGYQRYWETFLNVDWRPATNISISAGPGFQHTIENSQWVDVFDDPLATATFGRRYVFGEMHQTTVSASFRINWTFTPKLSLQIYIQPLLSAGDFQNFKELARAKSYEFDVYGVNGSTLEERRDSEGNVVSYVADPDGAGPAPPLGFDNPDFNFKSLRGNAVLRWEYLPGSALYVVWTQSRSDNEDIGEFQFSRSFRRLWQTRPDNIFMLKMTYWWGG